MTDFGRVGRISFPGGMATFMVIGRSSNAIVRASKKGYRVTMVLDGSGWWGSGYQIMPGVVAPIIVDDPQIEWLDDDETISPDGTGRSAPGG